MYLHLKLNDSENGLLLDSPTSFGVQERIKEKLNESLGAIGLCQPRVKGLNISINITVGWSVVCTLVFSN